MPKTANIPGKLLPQGVISAFVPAPLPPALDWTPRLIRVLSDADRLTGRLAGEGGRLPNPHVLMRPFVRREAVLSSKIEGTEATLGELLAAEAGAAVDRSLEDLREVCVSSCVPTLSRAFPRRSLCPVEYFAAVLRGQSRNPFRYVDNGLM